MSDSSDSSGDFITDSDETMSSASEDEEAKPDEPAAEPAPVKDPDTERFVRELEFVQCLANPRYLMFLSQRNFFGDPNFVNYLKYLLYWTRPEYIKYIRYPQAIHVLRLLQDPDFRKELANFRTIENIERAQYFYYTFYRRNRLDLTLPVVDVKTPPGWTE